MKRMCLMAVAAIGFLGLAADGPAPAQTTDPSAVARAEYYKVMYRRGTGRWHEEGGYTLNHAHNRAADLRAQGYTTYVTRDR